MSELTGKTIAQYQLVKVVDQGGTTHVYKGFQPSMNRYVGVKVLSPSLTGDEAFVRQFQQQAEILAKYEHTHLLAVYDYGQEEDVHYRVSRYVENGSLRDHLSWFYDVRSAQVLLHGIVEALEYIHVQGLVHGNLKPSNVLLDEQRSPLLTDFGLAQRVGVPANVYMSPEQVQGGTVDKRSDIYTLGVLLYEMLVGEPPPAGAVVSPRAKRPDLPQEIEKVIFKAMAQNPDQRYQTTSEFARALDEVLLPKAPQTVQPTAEPQPAPTAAAQPKKKGDTSWLVFLMGGLFIIIIIACGLIFVPSLIGDEGTAPAPTEPAPVDPTQPPPPTDEPPAPTEAPPEAGQPTLEPPGDGGIGDICGSVGFVGGALMLGLAFSTRRKWKRRV